MHRSGEDQVSATSTETHARSTAGWKGRRAAIIAVVGFISLLITYYAVNLWIVGLHSYKMG